MLRSSNLVILHPADQMLFVVKEMVLVLVFACQIIMVILTLIVDPNVFRIQIVQETRHALIQDVLIHVLEHAV